MRFLPGGSQSSHQSRTWRIGIRVSQSKSKHSENDSVVCFLGKFVEGSG